MTASPDYSYGFLCCAQIIFDELLPVYLKLDVVEGGLSFTSAAVGTVQIFAGAVQIGVQLALFPYFAHRFGALLCFRHATWPLALLALLPLIGAAARGSPPLAWTLLSILVIYKVR